MKPFNSVLFDNPGKKEKRFLCDLPGRHPKPQHVFRPAPLGIASVVAGNAFVFQFVYFAGVKRRGSFPECFDVFFPKLRISYIHAKISCLIDILMVGFSVWGWVMLRKSFDS